MIDIDPSNKGYYARRFKYIYSVARFARHGALDSILRPCRGASFVVWHPSLSYFARDYGLHQIALSPEGRRCRLRI